MDLASLKKYKAKFGKENDQNIFEHNQDLFNILNQIKPIYDINDGLYKDIEKCCFYHDTGKVTNEYQNDGGTNNRRKVRHEILSASYKDLTKKQRIAILLHHKGIKKISQRFTENKEDYYKFKNEFEEKLGIETVDLIHTLRKIRYPDSCDMLKDLDLILLKGYLQLCDHTASAGVKQIDKNLNTYEKFQFPSYNSIQKKIREDGKKRDIIIQAMTGLGKSATSMFWSDNVQNLDKSRRIYYILPFTASINSMYKEFKSKGISTGMLHSKAEYFLSKELEDIKNVKNTYSLFKKSIKQVTVCTIFQIVKVFFGSKNFEMLLSQLKNSIFIIDEIHCFQIKELVMILETLKYLKKNFDINVCVMSASIPTCLLNFIKEQLDIEEDCLITADKEDLIIRHKLQYYNAEIIDCLDKIKRDLNNGKQVLICVNSVQLSQKLYDIFQNMYDVKLIHGKFNARDREEIEKDLKGCQLLIGTQSIEVSLNISYDVMYTEVAPLDALLQRFGRVNRKGEKGIAEIHIFKDTSNVYDQGIIERTIKSLEKIIQNDDSQILEEKVNYYLDKVYTEFDIDEYKSTASIFNEIIDDIRCGVYDKNNNELESNFGVTVLPISLKIEYMEYLEQKKYLEANSLLVNVTRKTKDMYFDEKLNAVICNYKYTKEKGLEMYNFDDGLQ